LKRKNLIYSLFALILLGVLWNEGPGLRWEPEGLYINKNFRDVGASLNSCLTDSRQSPIFKDKLYLRSNKWFSGWSCDAVENPETIVTLNYQPDRKRTYFCWDGFDQVVGKFAPSNTEISDIEFYETWFNEAQRKPICANLEAILNSLNEKKRTLIHCDAGRDRTGAFSGIIAALATESAFGKIPTNIMNAIECDYQKSHSLKKDKYGRLEKFFGDVYSKHNSIAAFIYNRCNISVASVNESAHSFLK